MTSGFAARVLAAVRRVPPGRVATYVDIARVVVRQAHHALSQSKGVGRPRAWRAVGNIMRGCSAPDVPCHRIVAAGGRLGGYAGNLPLKRALLRAEGIVVIGSRIRGFPTVRWPSR